MKKLLFVFAASMCLFFMAPNQLDAQIGARAGLNMSNFSGDVEGNTTKMGFHIGVVYGTQISESLSFTPGLLYSLKGSGLDGVDESASATYLEIPLDLGYAVSDGFNINVGPYIGLLMSAKFGDLDVKDSYKSLDFGLNVGASYDVDLVSIGVGYGLGLANIADVEDDTSVKNTNITLYLVYPF